MPTVQHGVGGVMMWGHFPSKGFGFEDLVGLNDIMNYLN